VRSGQKTGKPQVKILWKTKLYRIGAAPGWAKEAESVPKSVMTFLRIVIPL
jgi:hypothetical protein